MRFEHDKMVLWYGTADAFAPTGAVPASADDQAIVTITAAVQPRSAGNTVHVIYRVNGGAPATVNATAQRQDLVQKVQYFSARLPPFQVGDKVAYVAVARSPGRQVPVASEASTFPSSFKVVAAGAGSTVNPANPGTAASMSSVSSSPSVPSATGGTAGKNPPSLTSPPSAYPTPKSAVSDAQLTSLLAASPGITSAMRARFVSIYNANQSGLTEFWEQLTKDPQLGPVVPQLQLLLQLGTLTLNNPDLVAKLLAQFHPASMRDLTKLDSTQLVKIITEGKIPVPKKIAATTTPATITQYADAIFSSLKQAFPTDFLAKSLGASTDTTHKAVAAFLGKSPDFDLATAKIDSYLASHSTALAGIPADQTAAFTDRLKATQRLLRITKDGDAIQTLIKLGLDSSYKIAATPRGAFLDKHADALGGQEKAAQIHANATSISAVTSHIIRHAQENAAPGTPRMITSGNGDGAKTLDANIPNWQTLFGSTSTCQCTECRAVDGPAAYFVSLLQFLENIGKNTAHPLLEVLLERRPDLVNLKLNCANADTALPYVDLVNEILESYVAHSKLSASTAHNTPTDATPEALGVNPEYLQTPDAIKAYETLNGSSVVHPFTLPFDRYLETMRTYLSFLGISRHQLLKEFGLPRPGNDAASPRLAAEYLQISEAEYVLITNQGFSGSSNLPKNVLFKYFGYSANDHIWQKKSLIEQVPEFLSRTGLVYSELLELLETQYLNPHHAIALQLANSADACDITAMRIDNVADLLPALPAFLRLRKKLDWKIAELDYALRAFRTTPGVVKGDNPRPIPVDFILVAAQLKQLQKTLNLSVGQTVSLWQNINTDGRGSHYNSLFQNKAVINPPDPRLRLLYHASLGTRPRNLPGHWSDATVQNLTFYDSDTKEMQFIGSMTDNQRDDLLQWAGNSDDAIAAVQALYSQRWHDGIEISEIHHSAPPASVPTQTEKVPSPAAIPLVADSIGNHVHAILAALRISSADLVAIGQDAGYCDPQSAVWAPATLTLGNLSMLYRYALLARSLDLSVSDLITLKNLTGLHPFNTDTTADGPVTDAMVQFVAAAHQVKASRFTIDQLAYLYGSDTGSASGLAPLQTTMDSIVSTNLVGLQNIAAANAFVPDPTGAALRKKLAALLPSAPQLDAIMSLISGSTIYISSLAALPSGVVLPAGQVSFLTAATIGGTITAQDSLTLTVASSAVTGSPVAVSYTVQPADTPNTIAAGLAAQINRNPVLVAAGISAAIFGAVIGLTVPSTLSPSPVWTASQSPAGASETVTLGGSLFCAGPMTGATAIALANLTSDPNFNNAIRDLYNQAQNILIQNLGLPAYLAALPALPAGVTLPPGQISFVGAVTIGGTVTPQDSVSLAMISSGVVGSPVTVSYAVQPTDTVNTIAAAVASQINANPALVTAGISAMAFGAIISLSSPPVLTPTPVWTTSASPSTATETVNMGGGLLCYGAMPNSTKAALLAQSKDLGFSTAINALYEQAWASSQAVGSVIANLIQMPLPSAPPDRYDYFLQKFLTYLANTQSRNLVKQSLTDFLDLNAGIVQLLVDGNVALGLPQALLPSTADPTEPAISDLLGGLSAAYYNSPVPDPAKVQKVQIDQGVNLDGTQSTFGSAEWTGKLLAPTTGGYSFAVPVTGPPQSGAVTQIALTIGSQTVNLVSGGGASGSANAINLTAGQLYDISLVVSGVPASARVQLRWCISPAPPGTFVTIPALAFTPCAADGSYPALALLYRIAVLIDGFSMKPREVAYLSTHPADFAGIDPGSGNSVPFALAGLASVSDTPALFNQWQRLDDLYRLKDSLPSGDTTLFDVFATASASPPSSAPAPIGTSISPLVVEIEKASRWKQEDLLALLGTDGLNIADATFRNEIPLIQLSRSLAICSRIGVSAKKLLEWANATGSEYSVAQDIAHTTKAKYDDTTWLQVGKVFNDKLRESSKNALITYILQMPHMRGFVDGNDLYGYFLIDVEMCACMETSRIVQACAAVQLFVQRCLLNLEEKVKPSAFTAEDVDEWNQFRSQYRVWQAGVEVLMCPENWWSPELRPDKTPFFKDLETALLQGDVNASSVEAAYLNYLESLQQVARLEIAGLYRDYDPEAGTDLTHVIGRTFTKPHVYFYRTLDNSGYAWSSWEKIDADISGDSLVPVVWHRRLFLFWPVYTEAADPSQNSPPAASLSTQNNMVSVPQSPPPRKTLQIQLGWTEYKGGKWTPKQVTAESLVPPGFASYTSTLDTSAFVFTAAPVGENQDGLAITGYSALYLPEEDANLVNILMSITMANFQSALKNNNPPSAGDIATAAGALQILIGVLGQLELVHVPANNTRFAALQKSAQLLSVLMQGSPTPSFTTTTFNRAYNELSTACASFSPQLDGPVAIPLGSFFFDGPQGSVETQPSITYGAGPEASGLFPAVAKHYGSSDTGGVSEFLNQDISLKSSDFSLLFFGSSPDPKPISVFAGKISGIDIAFPQQILPEYTFDVIAPTGENAVFYADRRRTYFVVQSSVPSISRLRDSKRVTFSESVPPESVYCYNHNHPWVGEFTKRLNWKGVSYLLDPSTQALAHKFDESHYRPEHTVAKPYPEEAVDFGKTMPALQSAKDERGKKSACAPPGDHAYGLYNWEIFFHIPLFIATCLSRNQKFADAQTWFHYIFNPTQDPMRKNVPHNYKRDVPNGYWNFQPLNRLDKDGGLQQLLDSVGGSKEGENAELNAQYQAWTHAPFEPEVIAQLRPVAYQKTVVMRYVDNLIKWGDYLFAQNTRDSIYEAIQYYLLADQIWGRRPTIIPQPGTIRDLTYDELAADHINALGNAQVQLENAFPLTVAGKVRTKGATGSSVLGTSVQTPYFCTPANPTLFAYYDTIADRLYKIRHCMNIEGQVEQLPLFAPPISPGLLMAAEAAGVDLSSVLSDMGAAVPHYRFTYMLSKALELCAEVRSLGAATLSAHEKNDAEAMALLHAGQELSLLHAVRQIKQMQIDEANQNLLALQGTLAVTTARQSYYEGLVKGGLSGYEIAQAELLVVSEEFKLVSQITDLGSAGVAAIPQVKIGINGAFGSPEAVIEIGGVQASGASAAVGRAFAALAEVFSFVATMAGMMGGWARRAAEWGFQLEAATLEAAQVQQQIKAAKIRVDIAKQDLANQDLQVAHASAVQDTLRSKFTNQELYSWMIGQTSALFFQCYQMAYDLSKRAEVCYRFELGIPQSNYIQFGYWDSLKKGLLAGEKLFKDLKRLENAYLEQNRREYEITKSISLLLLDPFALISLKLTGSCLIDLPEAYFDMDYPGHYMRRIKSIGLTIPCVTGPYTSVNCTLTLLQSKIRVNAKAASASSYVEKPIGSDNRFIYDFAASDSIATSTAQNDSGMFEVNFRDERYLPFEGRGVISLLRVAMPAECNAFDFDTITDVILNLRYTSRPGDDGFRAAAKGAAVLPPPAVQPVTQPGPPFPSQNNLLRYFSLRHEYPTEWYKFLNPADSATNQSMLIALDNSRFPYRYRGKSIKISNAALVLLYSDGFQSSQSTIAPPPLNIGPANPGVQLTPLAPISNPALNGMPLYLYAKPSQPAPPAPTQPPSWVLQVTGPSDGSGGSVLWVASSSGGTPYHLNPNAIADIFLICTFSTSS